MKSNESAGNSARMPHETRHLVGLYFHQPKDSNHYQINCNDVV
jgi:hypothetical protein